MSKSIRSLCLSLLLVLAVAPIASADPCNGATSAPAVAPAPAPALSAQANGNRRFTYQPQAASQNRGYYRSGVRTMGGFNATRGAASKAIGAY